MKLKAIYFDAYKSLLNKELTINHNCIGFVGTNESGKSNVLSAINVLGGEKLLFTDVPKMERRSMPQIRFEFDLSSEEFEQFSSKMTEWVRMNSMGSDLLVKFKKGTVVLTVTLDNETKEERRFFSILNLIELEEDAFVLQKKTLDEYIKSDYRYDVVNGESVRELADSIIVNRTVLNATNRFNRISFDYERLRNSAAEISDKIENLKQTFGGLTGSNEPDGNNSLRSIEEQIFDFTKARDKILATLEVMDKRYKENSVAENIGLLEKDLSERRDALNEEKIKLASIEKKIGQLNKVSSRTGEQEADLQSLTGQLAAISKVIRTIDEVCNRIEAQINFYSEGIEDKYVANNSELESFLLIEFEDLLFKFIPPVVFWEYSPSYILQSETSFSSLLGQINTSQISRPLMNIFRIGLGIKTIEELRSKIEEIQTESHERSRIAKILNRKVNDFIRAVWQDYDQEMHISLEENQIRIEIFDPKNNINSSYYNMKERSQGCQTFLSFLLTIGAEAEHDVMSNIILLLDEPETHLHPSGVRFMLQELIKISERNNLVIYATHSIFLIDRTNLDRHIRLVKEREYTNLFPANVGRIGYFMQEEVLYNTLDLNLGKDFSTSKKYNFVFEGDGDAVLFNHYYEKVIRDTDRPYKIKLTSFHQGGKCSDIQRYFSQRPIQLGTKWIFILDSDSPANSLKQFLESKYSAYINTEIFIFQYKLKEYLQGIELEDLLPQDLLTSTFKSAFEMNSVPLADGELETALAEKSRFGEYKNEVLGKIRPEETQANVRADFKRLLNKNVKEEILSITEKEEFQRILPLYSEWVGDVISKLK